MHIHRDGHEAALSVRANPFFRLAVAVLYDLFPPDVDELTAVAHALATPPPLAAVGAFWSDQVLHGYRALADLEPDRWLGVRFEDLVTEPEDTMDRIGSFFELPNDPAFATRAASRVRGVPPERFGDLSPSEQAELRDACRPGQILLGRA